MRVKKEEQKDEEGGNFGLAKNHSSKIAVKKRERKK